MTTALGRILTAWIDGPRSLRVVGQPYQSPDAEEAGESESRTYVSAVFHAIPMPRLVGSSRRTTPEEIAAKLGLSEEQVLRALLMLVHQQHISVQAHPDFPLQAWREGWRESQRRTP